MADLAKSHVAVEDLDLVFCSGAGSASHSLVRRAGTINTDQFLNRLNSANMFDMVKPTGRRFAYRNGCSILGFVLAFLFVGFAFGQVPKKSVTRTPQQSAANMKSHNGKKSNDGLPNNTAVKTMTCEKSGIEFVLIPAGKFTMGSPSDEWGRKDDETEHPVEITSPFY